MKYDLPDYLEEVINSENLLYAQKWGEEAVEWSQKNVYAKIAEYLPIQKEGIHADLGSGWGHLLEVLYKRNQEHNTQQKLIGIERNEHMAEYSVEYLKHAKVPAILFGAMFPRYMTISEVENLPIIHEPFSLNKEVCDSIDQLELCKNHPLVSIIMDDIRSAEVIDYILSDEKITSASFCFPGTATIDTLKAPFTAIDYKDSIVKERTSVLNQKLRESAMLLAAKHMETGGTIVSAERFMKRKEANTEKIYEEIQHTSRKQFGRAMEYWEPQKISISSDETINIASPITWLAPKEYDPQTHGKGVCIQSFIRNEKPTQS